MEARRALPRCRALWPTRRPDRCVWRYPSFFTPTSFGMPVDGWGFRLEPAECGNNDMEHAMSQVFLGVVCHERRIGEHHRHRVMLTGTRDCTPRSTALRLHTHLCAAGVLGAPRQTEEALIAGSPALVRAMAVFALRRRPTPVGASRFGPRRSWAVSRGTGTASRGSSDSRNSDEGGPEGVPIALVQRRECKRPISLPQRGCGRGTKSIRG